MANFKHHSYFTPEKLVNSYLFPNVCFACRKCFRRPISDKPRKCPECGRAMSRLNRKFKAPKKEEVNAWRVVEFVVASGFQYQSLHVAGARYPKTMKEAEEFVRLYGKASRALPSN